MITLLPHWRLPFGDPELKAGQVHVWRAVLEPADPETVDVFRTLLSEEERQRADRFHFERHRRRFTICRGCLRTLLGRYLCIPGSRLRLDYGPHGKPRLTTADGVEPIHFNLAHSHGMALLAFSRRQPLGIDLEYLRPMPRAEALAKRFFSAQEHTALQALPPESRQEAFFRCWTCKEAYVKAIGDGLAFPLDRFSVSLAPGEAPGLVQIEGATAAACGWTMTTMVPAPGYLAALVVRGHVDAISWWETSGHLTAQKL